MRYINLRFTVLYFTLLTSQSIVEQFRAGLGHVPATIDDVLAVAVWQRYTKAGVAYIHNKHTFEDQQSFSITNYRNK